MKVKFWGVRGSTPTPGPLTRKFGGNTSCIQVCTTGGQSLILDAGTGVRALGRSLAQEKPEGGHRIVLMLSHYHWDHIQGIPFFAPMYDEENLIYLHGLQSVYTSLEAVLKGQMADPYFPVNMGAMRATRHLYSLGEDCMQIGDARVMTRFLNHPQGCLGFRIEDDHGIFVYATDHEHGNPEYDRKLRELTEGADVIVYDAQYTPQEYKQKVGWGHSTWEEGVRHAQEAGVKHLILFHHDPDRSDHSLEMIVEQAREKFFNVHAGMEGMQLDIEGPDVRYSLREGAERRVKVRQPLPLRMVVRRDGGKPACVEASNISFDGMYFEADGPWKIGERLELEVQAPGLEAEKAVYRGRIVRCDRRGKRMGVAIALE